MKPQLCFPIGLKTTLCCVIWLLPLQSIFAQFGADSRWAPQSSNVIVLINSSRIFESALAKKEKAREASKAAFETGTSIITPDVDRILIASEMDFEAIHSLYSVAVFSRDKKPFDFNAIVNKASSNVESLAGRNAALLPNDAYLVQAGPQTMAVMKPGNRQTAGRWVRASTTSGSSAISDYLKQAVSFADANADMILAFDLEAVANPSDVRKVLPDMGIVPEKDLDAATNTLAQIKGLTLGITIRDAINGSLKIDFGTDVSTIAPYGKDLLIRILKAKGIMIDDINGWTPKSAGNTLMLSGPMSLSSLRAVSALVSQPMLPEYVEDASSASTAPYSRTKTYFDALDAYYKELSSKSPDYKSLSGYSVWFERYASKVDELSVLGVDKEVIDFGAAMADKLRQVSNILKDAELMLKAQKGYLRANSGVYYGTDYRYSSNGRISQQKALEKGGESYAEMQARELLTQLASGVADMRRQLTTKYNVSF